jgi:hypothetical protein
MSFSMSCPDNRHQRFFHGCTGGVSDSRPATGLPAAGSLCPRMRGGLCITTEVASVSTDIYLDQEHDDIMYPQVLPFLLVHAGCIAAIWSGVSLQAIAICVD